MSTLPDSLFKHNINLQCCSAMFSLQTFNLIFEYFDSFLNVSEMQYKLVLFDFEEYQKHNEEQNKSRATAYRPMVSKIPCL